MSKQAMNDWLTPEMARAIDQEHTRKEQLMRHQPHCRRCGSNQVQLMLRDPPAEWKCRNCEHRFNSEPQTR